MHSAIQIKKTVFFLRYSVITKKKSDVFFSIHNQCVNYLITINRTTKSYNRKYLNHCQTMDAFKTCFKRVCTGTEKTTVKVFVVLNL